MWPFSDVSAFRTALITSSSSSAVLTGVADPPTAETEETGETGQDSEAG